MVDGSSTFADLLGRERADDRLREPAAVSDAVRYAFWTAGPPASIADILALAAYYVAGGVALVVWGTIASLALPVGIGGALGCVEMRVNQVIVEPGEETTPHTHDGQEEVFVAQTDGQIAIEGEVHDVPDGGVVRVHPDTVRNLPNRTEDETHVRFAFGAPRSVPSRAWARTSWQIAKIEPTGVQHDTPAR